MVKNLKINLCHGPVKGVFTPGSTVAGILTVVVEEPKNYKRIVVRIKGSGHTSMWERSGEYSYEVHSDEDYVNLYQVVWKSEDSPDGVLPAGTHVYPFQIELPHQCPSTFDPSAYGYISYEIKGLVETGQLKLSHTVTRSIRVVEVVSVGPPDCEHYPFRIEKQKRVGCGLCLSGDISCSIKLPKTRFTVGEDIPVIWYVENGSGRRVSLRCSLVEEITFYTTNKFKSTTNTIVSQRGVSIPRHSVRENATVSVLIPPCRPAMTHSTLIKSKFRLVAAVVIPGATNLVTRIPVTIGNDSLFQQQP